MAVFYLVDTTDLDAIFEPYKPGKPKAQQTNYFYFDSSSGTYKDLNERYAKLEFGTAAPTTNYKVGSKDLNEIFCALGTADYILEMYVTTDKQGINLKVWADNTYSPNYNNYDKIIITIQPGKIMYAPNTSNFGLVTGVFPLPTTLINKGYIVGAGGKGGDTFGGSNGLPGGDAMQLNMNITLDNSSGYIFGGGGGGGGGGSAGCQLDPSDEFCTSLGGGGGGGQGLAVGSGGAGFVDGEDGNFSSPGSGGSPANSCGPCLGSGVASGGYGGNGGSWGLSGGSGTNGTQGGDIQDEGGDGGVAGYAIDTNGNSITWTGGNNSTRVKGNVSNH